MIFKDNTGVSVIQFGTGDLSIGPGVLVGSPASDAVSVSIMDNGVGKINGIVPHSKGKRDTALKVHTRLVFTEPDSCNVLIRAVEKARDNMLISRKRKSAAQQLTPPNQTKVRLCRIRCTQYRAKKED